MRDLPKYAGLEIERRWTVDPARMPDMVALPFRRITDLYLRGSRLRLRREDGERAVFKLCKKYGPVTDGVEPITNVYLSEEEYLALSGLPGDRSVKRRYRTHGGALDVYERPPDEVVFEVEFATREEARAYTPPDFVGEEITGSAERSGSATARRAGR